MIAYVKGIVQAKACDYVIIETYGIGYKIFMPKTYIQNLPEIGVETKVYTYYYVREDNISLYGFCEEEELRMFELLLSVSGVGAKSAIAILSEIKPSELGIAIVSNDVKALTKISGVGPKSAQRIILELKDKLKNVTMVDLDKNEKGIPRKTDNTKEEAMAALEVLGYNKREIEKAFEEIDTKNINVEGAIKMALKILGR